MKRILYISTLDPLAPRAHVYNVLQTVSALDGPASIRLVIPARAHAIHAQEHIRSYLGISKDIPFLFLTSWGTTFAGSRIRVVQWLEMILQSISFCRLLYRERGSFEWLYLRDFSLMIPALFARTILKKKIAYEVHAVLHSRKQEWRNALLVRYSDTVIAITDALRAHYLPTNPHITTVVCAAAEPERFANVTESKDRLRTSFGLAHDACVLGYTGNMGRTGNNDPYGIEDIIDALPLLPENVQFVGYGKRGEETKALETHIASLKLSARAHVRGHVGKTDVYRFLKACDILVIPSAGNQIGNAPSKTYEYLASNLPIVAASTVANREVLTHGENALLVNPKDPKAWAEAITHLSEDAVLSQKIVTGAQKTATQYTWTARAEYILNALQ